MNNNNCILGIDTSNYTTSLAIVDEQQNLLYDCRKTLTVGLGKKGLRQSEAFFQHIINMPILLEKVPMFLFQQIKKISVSNKPRPLPDSYMPVFQAGKSFGKSISHILNCEYLEFSHQENHIKAAQWSLQNTLNNPFIAVHLSGGTTEILQVEKDHYNKNYQIHIIGGTSDISAGQFIDRIGVKLGFPFPCGKAMDSVIMVHQQNMPVLPTAVSGTYMSFSGPETMAYKFIEKGYTQAEVISAVFQCIASSLAQTILNTHKETGLNQILLLGGVASSHFLRSYLEKVLHEKKFVICFGNPKYCTDNAVGTALLAAK